MTEISVAAFADSLSGEYQSRFSPAQIAAHAHVAVHQEPGSASVGIYPWHEPGVTGLCVVVDDRPGLLSLISAALAELGLSVHAAEAYTRTTQGGTQQAVDLFWLRDPGGTLRESEARAFAALLDEILRGRPTHHVHPEPAPVRSDLGTTVRFVDDKDGQLTVLEVETDDRSGLLWAITSALYGERVQIVSSRVTTVGSRVHDSFTIVELDGSPIQPGRRFGVQVAVLSAIE